MIKRKIFSIATVLILLISYVIPIHQFVYASEDYITVKEAIENNSGQATVKGYIVAHTIGTNNYDFDAPFDNDYNLAIADSPNETDPTKILPVQLPSSFRSKFGLSENPDNIGKEIFVTGSLESYFSVPGLKNPTQIRFSDEELPTPIEGLTIPQIQGEGHISPYKDQEVKAVEGIVTFVVDNANFYMQNPIPDDNDKTSEGILVYKPNHGVKVGDYVSVDGIVKEWVLDGYAEKLETDLSMTEINAQNGKIEVISENQPLPDPIILGEDVFPPTEIIDNDSFEIFDPNEDGIDFYESLEGMLVGLKNPMVIGPQKYGEIPVIVEKVEDKQYTESGGVLLTETNANPERIHILTDDRNFVTKTGDQFEGIVTGIVTYTYSNYKILTKSSNLPPLNEREYEEDITTIEKDEDKLTIASYNIENFDADNVNKTNKLAKTFLENLKSPDIIGLVEVMDNSGETDDGTTSASENYESIIQKIKDLGGPTYGWTDIAPENNQDGGVPGGNIRVGFLYNTERVSLVEGVKGKATDAVDYRDGKLTLNPGRIDPTNKAFENSRKPLAAQFNFKGEDVIVIANHFNSKSGDEPLFGKNQPPTLSSEVKRIEQAKIVNQFVSKIFEQNEKANVIVLGDLNDYQFSKPIQTLKGKNLTNLIDFVSHNDRYTYIYQGNSQVLDHILVSNKLAKDAQVDIIHVNADYMDEHNRVSDHDIVLAQLNLAVDDTFDLTVMHVNDSHAHVEQYPRLYTAVNEVRNQYDHTLLLDAGDVFSGTLYFNQYLGLADLYFMNDLGYDAMTFGNHEFDKDSATLANFIKEMKFPMVSANVNVTQDPVLNEYFEDEILSPGEGGKIYPAIVKEFDGEKVGIFGLTTEDTEFLASPSDDIVFENVIEKAKETVKRLEQVGINKIIALTHIGDYMDLKLADSVDGIDVIVGGHSHTKIDSPIVIEKEEPTLIVQANEYLNYLGLLNVSFDEEGTVVAYNGQLLDLANYEEDPTAKAKVEEFARPLEELKKTIIGSTEVFLNGERNDVRTKETNLGNMIADAMVEKANEFVPTTIGLQNGGGIRASIEAGEISLGDVLTVMPFANQLVTLELSGAEIWEALEHSVGEVENAQGRFLQVSGLRFKYDINQPPGQRVWLVEVKNENGTYEPIDLNSYYNVATNAYIADGGDGFEVFKKAKDEQRIKELFIVDYEVLKSYIEKNSPISPKVEGRIIMEAKKDHSDDPNNPDDPNDPNPGDGKDSPKTIISKVKVENGIATIPNQDIEKVNKGDTFIVDLGEEESVKVILTAEQLQILKANKVSFVIKNKHVTLSIPLENLPDDKEIIIELKRLKDMDKAVSKVYDFTITADGEVISKFEKPIILAFVVDMKKVKNKDHLHVYFYNEKKKQWEKMDGSKFEDGMVKAPTNHFSTFAVFEDIDEDSEDHSNVSTPPEDKKLPNTATENYNLLVLGIILLLVASTLLFVQKRLKRE